jgi:acyl-coenzyme A synthetase/AMP-(fatty) acid ligase/acyl carrier protein
MFRGVRQLLTGGEALSVSHIDRALHLLPDTTLINCYGPTEATTFTCAQTIPRPRPQTWASIPIGQPIAHTQVFILDPQGEPTPIGVAGELFIGGDGLAREYFNAPRRTAASFVPHPFARHPGERLYASGDLACWREDGSIAFLGRRDQQVKIRGFRIELGEIESVLASHPSVAQCVVVAHQSAAGEKRLVAYLVSKPEAAGLSNGSLLTFLKKHLPQYMLPADLVMLETLPLTPNGKVDRPKLSLLSGVQLQRDEEYCPPQTPTQELLASIWAEVLRLPKVGIHDDFFLLGGHSLLAMQVVSRIRDLFHINVPVKSIFEAPTVDQFSTVLINYEPTPCQVEKMAEIFKQVQAQTLVTK